MLHRFNHFRSRCRLRTFRSLTMDVDVVKTKFRIGVVQMTSTDDRDRNYNICSGLANIAKSEKVEFLCFPECFHFIGGGDSGLKSTDIAEPIENSPSLAKYQELAKETQCSLSLGGFQEKSDDENKVYNTHVIIDRNGNIIETYRKIHLFDYKEGGLVESNFTLPGNEVKMVKSDSINIGLSTCYDLRFPELYQALRQMNSKIMLVPSAFTTKTGKAHWHSLLQARAIETQSFVVAAAQAGYHHAKRRSYGHSLVVDPWGSVIAEAETNDSEDVMNETNEQLLVVDLDLDLVETIRRKMPVMEHKRYDVFGNKE
jgi:predicted amidohydrolase